MPAGSTYTPIASTTLTASATEINFTSVSSAYTDLVLVCNLGMSRTGAAFFLRVGNGTIDTGSNYSETELYGTGSAAGSARRTSSTEWNIFSNVGSSTTTGENTFIMQFMNYSNTTTNKTVLGRANNASSSSFPGTAAAAFLWRSTSAINTIRVVRNGTDTFNSGSTFTLYGIAAA
jgi:hypothetical protein